MDKKILVVCPDKMTAKRLANLTERTIAGAHLTDYIEHMFDREIKFKNGSGIAFISEDMEMRGRVANKIYVLDHENISEDMRLSISSIKYSVEDCELLEL